MTNRLARATSPYLLQHADNPVDWYEWGDEAFAAARERDVPILLSVGYSACHWCHVMAHESFEDPETAAEMNRLFVNVKVDREERPDIDAIYMQAVQALSGHGGWPMTVWLTPDGRPFYAGTYFPKTDRHGMPAFRRVMAAVADAWRHRRDEVLSQAERITEAIDRTVPPSPELPPPAALERALRMLAGSFDRLHGGFGGAPKFPQQPTLEFLLRVASEPWAGEAADMARRTLRAMDRGGIHDHVGGGFARYAVDDRWTVPHFEKMLYDNAQLARLYLWGGIELEEARFLEVAVEVLDYLRRDLRHPDGGFYAAEDADSEGEEGKFYVWTAEEFSRVLGDDAPLAATMLGVTPEGNFEGANVLTLAATPAEAAARHGCTAEEAEAVLRRCIQALFEARRRRVRPGLDDKILASWNGLAVRAFAEAGAALDRPDLVDEAREAARFVLTEMRDGTGRLLHVWAKGEARIPGFLDDHAAMATGLFALYQATGEVEWYEAAEELTRQILTRFPDPDGGFFTTPDDGEALVTRPKDQMDNPLPSGNSLAAEALVTLSAYTGEADLRAAAEGTIRAGGRIVARYPSAAGHLLAVLASVHRGVRELAVVGPDAPSFARRVWTRFRPHVVMAWSVEPDGRIPLLVGRGEEGRTLAYLCRNFVCDLPVDTPDALGELLDQTTGGSPTGPTNEPSSKLTAGPGTGPSSGGVTPPLR